MTKTEAYNRLKEIKEEFPELTFDNVGYQYLKPLVKERHEKQISEISAIMKEQFPEFVKFNNFKPRVNGDFSIRCQTVWSPIFTGVQYYGLTDFQEEGVAQ